MEEKTYQGQKSYQQNCMVTIVCYGIGFVLLAILLVLTILRAQGAELPAFFEKFNWGENMSPEIVVLIDLVLLAASVFFGYRMLLQRKRLKSIRLTLDDAGVQGVCGDSAVALGLNTANGAAFALAYEEITDVTMKSANLTSRMVVPTLVISSENAHFDLIGLERMEEAKAELSRRCPQREIPKYGAD